MSEGGVELKGQSMKEINDEMVRLNVCYDTRMNEVSPVKDLIKKFEQSDFNDVKIPDEKYKKDVNRMMRTKKSQIKLLIEKFERLNMGIGLATLDSCSFVFGEQSVLQVESMETENGLGEVMPAEYTGDGYNGGMDMSLAIS